jgi:hypothetical protein
MYVIEHILKLLLYLYLSLRKYIICQNAALLVLSEKCFFEHSNLPIQQTLTELRYDTEHHEIHNSPFDMLAWSTLVTKLNCLCQTKAE